MNKKSRVLLIIFRLLAWSLNFSKLNDTSNTSYNKLIIQTFFIRWLLVLQDFTKMNCALFPSLYQDYICFPSLFQDYAISPLAPLFKEGGTLETLPRFARQIIREILPAFGHGKISNKYR